MAVYELALGESAPNDCDRIMLRNVAGGRFRFEAIHKTGGVTHHSTFHETYETEEAALHAALQWAERSKIENVYVERSTDA